MASLLVGLSGIDMASRARAPLVRVINLPRGTFLQKELSLRVKDPKMNCPVQEVIHMDLATEA
jgi:hypothetical protein